VSARYLSAATIQRLRQIHQRQKLPAIAEAVLAARTLGKPGHLVVTEIAGVFAAAQMLAEGRDRRGEAEVGRSRSSVLEGERVGKGDGGIKL